MLMLSAQAGLASPKEDCALVVQHLGYPTEKYSFVESGLFTMERHVFDGVITCYVTSEKKIDSIYRGDLVLVEEGYFGIDALLKKRRLKMLGNGRSMLPMRPMKLTASRYRRIQKRSYRLSA